MINLKELPKNHNEAVKSIATFIRENIQVILSINEKDASDITCDIRYTIRTRIGIIMHDTNVGQSKADDLNGQLMDLADILTEISSLRSYL